MPRLRVLSVGQCGYDHGQISHYFDRTFGADVLPSDTQNAAIAALRDQGPFDLVLVNRIGDRDGAPGVALIQTLKTDPDLARVPVILVSNYESAQAEAQALGALPGFGKAELGSREAEQRIRAAFSIEEPSREAPR